MAAEIAIAAAGIVLSPFLQAFFERMAAPEFDGFFWGRKVSNRLLRKLEIALLSVNAVLEDAEGRQFMETSVKKWLDEVKDTVYDAEDILDEIATKDLQRKLDSEFGTIASKVIRNEIQTPHIFLHLLLNCCHSLPIGFVDCAGSNWVNQRKMKSPP